MSLKHYYVEDITVDPARKDKVKPVRSIQFDLLSNTIYINIDEPNGAKLTRASVQIPKEELQNACDWFFK